MTATYPQFIKAVRRLRELEDLAPAVTTNETRRLQNEWRLWIDDWLRTHGPSIDAPTNPTPEPNSKEPEQCCTTT